MCRSKYASDCCLSAHPRPFTPRQQPPTIPFSVSPCPPSLALLGLQACLPPPSFPFPIPYRLFLFLDLAFSLLVFSVVSYLSYGLLYPCPRCLTLASLACSIPYRLLLSFPSLASSILYHLVLFLMLALSYALAFPFLCLLYLLSPCMYARFLPSYTGTTNNSSSF